MMFQINRENLLLIQKLNFNIIKKIFLLIIIFLITFNGWIEDKLEKTKPTKQEIEKKLSINYTNIINSIQEFRTNYVAVQNEFSTYTNYTKLLLETDNLSNKPDKIAEYKIKYLDMNKTLKSEQDNINIILNLLNTSMEKIKFIKDNIIASNRNFPDTVSITTNIFNKYNKKYVSYKSNFIDNNNNVTEFIKSITDINEKIENLIKKRTNTSVTKNIVSGDRKQDSNMKDTSETMPKLKKLNIKPKSKTLLNKANILFNKGKYDDALKVYEEAIKYDKRNYLARENISKIHLKKGNIDKAIEEINKAIKAFKELE